MAYGAGARKSAVNRLSLIVVAALGAAFLAYLFLRPPALTAGGIDFSAFYCASRAVSEGANPYRSEPVHACEHTVRTWPHRADLVVAPLPPYGLALLAPLARLPYRQAGLLWFVLLMASAAAIVWAILELTKLPLLLVGGCIAIAVLLQSLPTGALAPIPIALLCSAAVLLERRKWTAATVALGLACIEPHMAVPAMLATFVLVREMRARVVIVALSLAILSIAVAGPSTNLQYFESVLPEHARFEMGSIVQFGTSSMLHDFGLSDTAALAIGSLQYATSVALGILLAARYRSGTSAMVVLVSIAFAVSGGVYIHLTQLAAVLPLAFVVASRSHWALAWAGVALLTVPWNLLGALTPGTLTVPPIAAAAAAAAAGVALPGASAYVANLLVYAGVGLILWTTYFMPDAVMKAACVTSNPPRLPGSG